MSGTGPISGTPAPSSARTACVAASQENQSHPLHGGVDFPPCERRDGYGVWHGGRAVVRLDVKRMRLRHARTCARCGESLAAGTTADYDRAGRTVACLECPPLRALADESADAVPSGVAEEPLRSSAMDAINCSTKPGVGTMTTGCRPDTVCVLDCCEPHPSLAGAGHRLDDTTALGTSPRGQRDPLASRAVARLGER